MKGLEDMSKYNMYSMNPISPDMGVSNYTSTMKSDAAYANVGRVLHEAWMCGNITIDPTSAFWICLHMPKLFENWEELDSIEKTKMQEELLLFKEVDPQIMNKVHAVITYENRPVGRSSSLLHSLCMNRRPKRHKSIDVLRHVQRTFSSCLAHCS